MSKFTTQYMKDALAEHCMALKYGTPCTSRRCLIDAGFDPSKGPPVKQGVTSGTCAYLRIAERLDL